MAAVMMQAHGTETMIAKDGNKYSADFRYKNVDYEQDEYNGRCYFLDTSRSFTSQVAREGGLVRRRISRAAYEEAKAAAIKVVEQAAALEEAAKGTQEEWEKALDLFGEYLTGGVSREWAAYFARQEGCTTGKKVICKSCRISRRIEKCSLQKKCGEAGKDGDGTCLGFGKPFDDEPIEQCKRCIACTSFNWEEEKHRLSIEGRNRKRGK